MPRLRLVTGCLAFLAPALLWSERQYNLTPGVTEVSANVYQLHMLMLYVCIVIGVLVFSVMLYALVRHRKSLGHTPARFHESTLVEVIWTLIPFAILIALAVPATKTLILMDDTRMADVTIKITGHQWKWQYDYLDHDIGFFSNLSTPVEQIHNKQPKGVHYLLEVDRPLVLPTHKKIRFLVTANDVIHSWWVPALAVKKDTIPGFINETWAKIEQPGTYRGQCAELCGIGHGFMPIVVEAKPEEEFLAWVAEQKEARKAAEQAAKESYSMEQLMQQGEATYNKVCAACHQVNGLGIPGVFPAMKDSPVVLGDINTHLAVILRGIPGTAMQAFASQLNDLEIAAVITYERNAWGNNTGDIMQPSVVRNAR